MDKTEKIVTDFMKETMPFTYKANNDGRLMTNLANFYDWLELKKQLPIHGVMPSACNYYMAGNDTAMNCNNCGEPKYMH